MKADHQLESRLRAMIPAHLPADLRERMTAPPAARAPIAWKRALMAIPPAAAAVWLLWPGTFRVSSASESGVDALTVHESRSVLIESRPLRFIEHHGRVWELAEETWRDEQLAFCTSPSFHIHATETNRRLVCQPVDFD